jgi:hypothetical protein
LFIARARMTGERVRHGGSLSLRACISSIRLDLSAKATDFVTSPVGEAKRRAT